MSIKLIFGLVVLFIFAGVHSAGQNKTISYGSMSGQVMPATYNPQQAASGWFLQPAIDPLPKTYNPQPQALNPDRLPANASIIVKY